MKNFTLFLSIISILLSAVTLYIIYKQTHQQSVIYQSIPVIPDVIPNYDIRWGPAYSRHRLHGRPFHRHHRRHHRY